MSTVLITVARAVKDEALSPSTTFSQHFFRYTEAMSYEYQTREELIDLIYKRLNQNDALQLKLSSAYRVSNSRLESIKKVKTANMKLTQELVGRQERITQADEVISDLLDMVKVVPTKAYKYLSS